MIDSTIHTTEVTIKINLSTGDVTTTATPPSGGQEPSRPELDEIAKHPQKGMRWRVSVFQFPGSNCWVVQMPGGDRVFCA